MSSTLDHYNRSAARYAEVNHQLEAPQAAAQAFLERVKTVTEPGRRPRILDAGSGTGRDTLAFMHGGADVDAFDGSEAMSDLSSRLTGQTTRVMRFEELDLPLAHYDGIWAMASLLHVDRSNLPGVFSQLGQALRPGGLLYASFKYGTSSRVNPADGRAFTDMDENAIESLLQDVDGFELVSTALSTPPSSQSNQEPWFSCELRRVLPAPRSRPSRKP